MIYMFLIFAIILSSFIFYKIGTGNGRQEIMGMIDSHLYNAGYSHYKIHQWWQNVFDHHVKNIMKEKGIFDENNQKF